jgi:hypothetical protein
MVSNAGVPCNFTNPNTKCLCNELTCRMPKRNPKITKSDCMDGTSTSRTICKHTPSSICRQTPAQESVMPVQESVMPAQEHVMQRKSPPRSRNSMSRNVRVRHACARACHVCARARKTKSWRLCTFHGPDMGFAGPRAGPVLVQHPH